MAEHPGACNDGQISAAVNQNGWVGVMHGSLGELHDSVSTLELYLI